MNTIDQLKDQLDSELNAFIEFNRSTRNDPSYLDAVNQTIRCKKLDIIRQLEHDIQFQQKLTNLKNQVKVNQ